MLFKPEKFENAGFEFYRGRKIFWKQSFPKTMSWRWSCNFPTGVFLKHKSKVTGNCCDNSCFLDVYKRLKVNIYAFLYSSGVVWTENIWCFFRGKRRFKFLGCNLDGAFKWRNISSLTAVSHPRPRPSPRRERPSFAGGLGYNSSYFTFTQLVLFIPGGTSDVNDLFPTGESFATCYASPHVKPISSSSAITVRLQVVLGRPCFLLLGSVLSEGSLEHAQG